jgi:hypothetical protein
MGAVGGLGMMAEIGSFRFIDLFLLLLGGEVFIFLFLAPKLSTGKDLTNNFNRL